MASIAVGTAVTLTAQARAVLRYQPGDGVLRVVVHPGSLRAPQSPHTQVAAFTDRQLTWLGALGEDLLERAGDATEAGARADLADCLLRGDRLWEIVCPGPLVRGQGARPLSTIYQGTQRPWLVLGEAANGWLIAAPLNQASNPKWYAPVVPQTALFFPGNAKDSQVELAHAWTLPPSLPNEGVLLPDGIDLLQDAVWDYYGC